MFKGPTGPVSGQTGRTIAEQKNDAKNFEEGPKYDYVSGTPITKDTPKQQYRAATMPAKSGSGGSEIEAPFTIKGS